MATVDVADLMEGEHDIVISEENLAETIAYQHMLTYIQTLHDVPDFAIQQGFPECTALDAPGAPPQAALSPPGNGGRDRCTSQTHATHRSRPIPPRTPPRFPG